MGSLFEGWKRTWDLQDINLYKNRIKPYKEGHWYTKLPKMENLIGSVVLEILINRQKP